MISSQVTSEESSTGRGAWLEYLWARQRWAMTFLQDSEGNEQRPRPLFCAPISIPFAAARETTSAFLRREMTEPLFERILGKPDVFYRHQQSDDPDLTEGDKRGILDDLMTTNKALFLQRYGKYMNASDCALFRDESDPLIQFMVAQIEKRKPDAQNASGFMKKRRFLMLQKLKEEGKYFSEEKMREREPYLYDVMVGKFTDAKDQLNLRPSVSREECPEGGWASM
ncbi:hypothetical protein OSTOST_21448, partial [Ostertagia ostertagi]